MLGLRKRAVIIPVIVSVTFLIASGVWVAISSPTKASQCYLMISAINQGLKINPNQGKQAATTNKLAHELNQVSQDLAAVNLSDPQLQERQNQFVKVFQTLSQALAQAGKALDSAKQADLTLEGRIKVEKAKSEIEANGKTAAAAAAQADFLAADVNRYCSQK